MWTYLPLKKDETQEFPTFNLSFFPPIPVIMPELSHCQCNGGIFPHKAHSVVTGSQAVNQVCKFNCNTSIHKQSLEMAENHRANRLFKSSVRPSFVIYRFLLCIVILLFPPFVTCMSCTCSHSVKMLVNKMMSFYAFIYVHDHRGKLGTIAIWLHLLSKKFI